MVAVTSGGVLGLRVPCRKAAGSAPTRARELCAHTCARSHAVGVYLLTAHMRRLQKAENVNCMQICIYELRVPFCGLRAARTVVEMGGGALSSSGLAWHITSSVKASRVAG